MAAANRFRKNDVLTLEQITCLKDKKLVELFSVANADEYSQKYSFRCCLFPGKCNAVFSSFRNEEKAKREVKAHLMMHVQELVNTANATGGVHRSNFTAETISGRQKREKQLLPATKRKPRKSSPAVVKETVKVKEEPVDFVDDGYYDDATLSDVNVKEEASDWDSDDSYREAQKALRAAKRRKVIRRKRKMAAAKMAAEQKRAKAEEQENEEDDDEEKYVMTTICENGEFVSKIVARDNSTAGESPTKKCKVVLNKVVKEESFGEEADPSRSPEPEIIVCEEPVSSDEEEIEMKEALKSFEVRQAEKQQRRTQMMQELCPDSDIGEDDDTARHLPGFDHDHSYTSTEGPKYVVSSDSEIDVETCEDENQHQNLPPDAQTSGIQGIRFQKGKLQKMSKSKSGHFLASKRVNQTHILDEAIDNLSSDADSESEAEKPGKTESNKKRKQSIQLGSLEWERYTALKAIKKIRLYKNRGEQYPLTCKICKDKTFTALATLMYHYRSHAGIKPFMCSICETTFTRQHSLNYHMLIHNNESRFSCPDCNRKFRHPSHFKEHLRRHTGETPYECRECSLHFKTRNTFKRHLRARHFKILTSDGLQEMDAAEVLHMQRTMRISQMRVEHLEKLQEETNVLGEEEREEEGRRREKVQRKTPRKAKHDSLLRE